METIREIRFAEARYGDGAAKNVAEVLSTGRLCDGRFSREFADRLVGFTGSRNVVLVNSGSSANLLAVASLGLGPGDEVITSACCFPTTVAPIVQAGAVPVFVDVELGTYNPSVSAVKNALTERTRAVVLAHTLGNPFDAVLLRDLCDTHGLWLVEDCCDALGSEVYEEGVFRRVGVYGHVATLSFYPAHHISTGEGGAVLVNDNRLLHTVYSLRDWGRDCVCRPGVDNTCNRRFDFKYPGLPEGYDHKYIYSRFGYNLKMTELQAAVGVDQMNTVNDVVRKRRENWTKLRGLMDGCGEYVLPIQTKGTIPSWFGFALTAHRGGRKKAQRLEEQGIQTRPLFAGNITRHPCMDGVAHRIHGDLKNSTEVLYNTFWVGVHQHLSESDMGYMAEKLWQA